MSVPTFTDHSKKIYILYLLNRSFRVNIKNKYSTIAKIGSGIPQECILGSLLFLLFVNNMNQAVDCDIFLYAHDPCLVYQYKNLKK